MENSSAIAFNCDEIILEEHLSKKTGKTLYQKIVVDDPDTGMIVKLLKYPKGYMVPLHTHDCAHGCYVLKGTLVTSEGNYGPGSFIWFKEGPSMYHGAGEEEDAVVLFITNKPLNMNYL